MLTNKTERGIYLHRFFLISVFSLIISIVVQGQPEFEGFSINPKIGIYGQNSDDGGFVGGIELNKLKHNTIYSIDYYLFGEFTLMDPIPADVYNQIGIMIGKYVGKKYFRFQYQAGAAPFFGKIMTEMISGEPGTPSYNYYEKDQFFTLGLVAKAGFKLIPARQFAVGIDLQTNLNSKRSVFYPCISLEIGKLKN